MFGYRASSLLPVNWHCPAGFLLLGVGEATMLYTSEGSDPQLHFVLELMAFVLQSGWTVFPCWEPPAIRAKVLLGMGLAPW